MSAEPPIEITHVPPRLRADFTGRLPEAATGSPQEREANFLTRALAAFAIHKLSGCTLDEAASGVVDGGGDGGIDAVFYSPNTHRLWVVQSKYHQTGLGEPDLGSVTKFKVGLENLLDGKFTAFGTNAAWAQIVPKLQAIFRDGALEVRAVLVYSGIHAVSEDRRRLFDDLKNRFSAEDDYLQIQPCNLTTVHDWLTGADEAVGVAELEFTLLKPGWVTEPYETVYGLIPLAELASLHNAHGRKLITANIRAYKGDTAVNEQIVATVKQEAEHFFYLNNGLTAYCSRLEVNNLDRGNAQRKRIRAFGLSIVNGAQTLGSVAQCFDPMPNPVPAGHAFLKVVSLERCADDRQFAGRITHSTNFQNQIGARDFVALDEQQERIANQLILSGIHYHYKDGVDTPTSDASNFTLDEATTACAALSSDCDFLARILANRKSLWSLEEVYPTTDIAAVVARTTALVTKETIDIPRILVVPTGEVKSGYKPFELKLDTLHYPPVSEDLWVQYLRTNEREVISVGRGGIEERRLEDYIVSGLVDFDDVSYDDHADFLYDFAAQTVRHFQTYLSEDDARKVLRCYQQPIAQFIHSQMQEHYWEEASGYEVKVTRGFTELRRSAYTAGAKDSLLDYRVSPQDKSNMAKYLFGGFKYCLFDTPQKFQSDAERRLAVILEREGLKWFRPAKGQFQIFYKSGANSMEYQPDFVAETADCIFMLEPKDAKQLNDEEVLAKKTSAVTWCNQATDHAVGYGGKGWTYVLIPHNAITDNMTVTGLASAFAVKS